MKYFVSFLTICLSFILGFMTIKKSLSAKKFDGYTKGDAVWVL